MQVLSRFFNDQMTWSEHNAAIRKRSKKRLDIISKMRYLLHRLCGKIYVNHLYVPF